jgi:hypothetical protein
MRSRRTNSEEENRLSICLKSGVSHQQLYPNASRGTFLTRAHF